MVHFLRLKYALGARGKANTVVESGDRKSRFNLVPSQNALVGNEIIEPQECRVSDQGVVWARHVLYHFWLPWKMMAQAVLSCNSAKVLSTA
jgi:hypothetical protein